MEFCPLVHDGNQWEISINIERKPLDDINRNLLILRMIICFKETQICIFGISTVCNIGAVDLWPLLLTWFNFNPSMDK